MTSKLLKGMEGVYEEELRSLIREVETLRARLGKNSRTISAAENILRTSWTELEELKTELRDDGRDIIDMHAEEAPLFSLS